MVNLHAVVQIYNCVKKRVVFLDYVQLQGRGCGLLKHSQAVLHMSHTGNGTLVCDTPLFCLRSGGGDGVRGGAGDGVRGGGGGSSRGGRWFGGGGGRLLGGG